MSGQFLNAFVAQTGCVAIGSLTYGFVSDGSLPHGFATNERQFEKSANLSQER